MNSAEGGTWGLVGGIVEDGESAQQAARRESVEEIGYHPAPSRLAPAATYHRERPGARITFDVFACSVSSEEMALDLNPDEHTELARSLPQALIARADLMAGLYPVLEDLYKVRRTAKS